MKKFVCKKSYSPLILFLILAVSLVRMFLAAYFVIYLFVYVEPTGLTESAEPTGLTELAGSTDPTILYGTYDPSEDTETGVYTETTGSGNMIQHSTIAGCDIGESFSLNMVTSDFSIKLETTGFTSTNNGIVGTKLYYKDVYVANLCYSNIYDFTELQDAYAYAFSTGIPTIGWSGDVVDMEIAREIIEVNSVRLGDQKSSTLEQLGEADYSFKNETTDIINYFPTDSIHFRLQFVFDDSEELVWYQINYK